MPTKPGNEYRKKLAVRYKKAGKKEKREILDEFIRTTDYHRKSAIRILSGKYSYATKPDLRTNAISDNKPFLSGSWSNHDVTITFYCEDNVSGVKELSAPITLTIDGKEQSVSGICTDNAGNDNIIEFKGINIDKTPPLVEISASPSSIWPPDGKMVDVNITGYSIDDNPDRTTFQVLDEYGIVEPSMTDFNQTIALQAKRNGDDKDGRKYTIKAISQDKAGNSAMAETFVIVPHDKAD